MNLNNLTITIITYNRYCFLKRLIGFYQAFETEVKILVLDSSSEKLEDEILIAQLESENVLWKRYAPSIFFAEKIAKGSEFINTEYAVLCADDDFLFPSSLDKAVKFLQTNQDYSSCLGLQYKHQVVSFFSKKIILFRESAIGGSKVVEERSSERILKYLSGRSVYYPMYAVQTTKDLKNIWQETSEIVSDWGLSEVFPCSISLSLGKMNVLQVPYTTRERNSFTWYNDSRVKEMYSFEKTEIVKKRLGEIVSKADEISTAEGIAFATKAINILIKRVFNNIDDLSSYRGKVKLKIIALPFIGIVLGKLYAEVRGLLVFYILNRARPLKYLNTKTKEYLSDALINNNCSQKDIVNSRKDY